MKLISTRRSVSVIVWCDDSVEWLSAALLHLQNHANVLVEVLLIGAPVPECALAGLCPHLRGVDIRCLVNSRGDATNAAIAAAQGELLAFLRAGDVWLPGKLFEQARFHQLHPALTSSWCEAEPIAHLQNALHAEWHSAWGAAAFHRLDVAAEGLWWQLAGVSWSSVMLSKRGWCALGGFRPEFGALALWEYLVRSAVYGRVAACGQVRVALGAPCQAPVREARRMLHHVLWRYRLDLSAKAVARLWGQIASARVGSARKPGWARHCAGDRSWLGRHA